MSDDLHGLEGARPVLGLLDTNLQDVRDRTALEDKIKALTAQSSLEKTLLKANFKQQLNELLRDVAEEEEAHRSLQSKYSSLLSRHNEVSTQAAQYKAENSSLLAQLEYSNSRIEQLSQQLGTAEQEQRDYKRAADSAADILKQEAERRQEDAKRAALNAETLDGQHKSALEQVQQLIEQLAQRDEAVANKGREANRAFAELKTAKENIARLEAVARATGERAAAAEASLAARADSAALLHTEVCKLRERYLSELSELKMLKAAAAEADRYKAQLDAAQGVSAALVEARDELRSAVSMLTSRLAGAEERARRFAASTSIRDSVLEALAGIALDEDASSAIDAISTELDIALHEAAEQGGKAAELAAGLAQQEQHVRRLVQEAAEATRKQRSKDEHTTQLQRMVSELQAEMQRLASQTEIGPPIILDFGAGVFRTCEQQGGTQPVTPDGRKADNKLAPAASQLETAATAMRVAIADRGYGLRAMATSLAASPSLPLDALQAYQRSIQAMASDLATVLGELSDELATRPLEAPASLETLRSTLESANTVSMQLTKNRNALNQAQVEVAGLEERASAADSAVRTALSMLGSWGSLIGRIMAEGEAVDEGTRNQLRDQIKVCEDELHRACSQLAGSATAGTMAAGDQAFAEAEKETREAVNALLELAARLPDREMLSDSKLKSAIMSTEATLREKQRALGRFKGRLGGVPADCSGLAAHVGAVLADLGALVGSGEELERVLVDFIQAGSDAPVDVVAMQGEVLALRAQVREKERVIQELEAAGGSGSAVRRGVDADGGVRSLVSLEALQASERAREALEDEAGKLHAQLVQQRLKQSNVRFTFVGYFARLREESLLQSAFSSWRAVVSQAKIERTEEALGHMQEEKERLEMVAKSRRASVANVLQRMLVDTDGGHARSALLAWRLAASRKIKARHHWITLTEGILEVHTRFLGALPDFTVAQRLAGRTLARQDPFARPPPPPPQDKLMGLAFFAWRMWSRIKSRGRQVGALSASMPAWVAAMGDRRRLERAWLGWRIHVVSELVGRANDLLERVGQQAVGRHSRSTAGWSQGGLSSLIDPTPRPFPTEPALTPQLTPQLPLQPPLPPAFQHPPAELYVPAQPPLPPALVPAEVPTAQWPQPQPQSPSRVVSAPGVLVRAQTPSSMTFQPPPPQQLLPHMQQFGYGHEMGTVGMPQQPPLSTGVQMAPPMTGYPQQPHCMSSVQQQSHTAAAESQAGALPQRPSMSVPPSNRPSITHAASVAGDRLRPSVAGAGTATNPPHQTISPRTTVDSTLLPPENHPPPLQHASPYSHLTVSVPTSMGGAPPEWYQSQQYPASQVLLPAPPPQQPPPPPPPQQPPPQQPPLQPPQQPPPPQQQQQQQSIQYEPQQIAPQQPQRWRQAQSQPIQLQPQLQQEPLWPHPQPAQELHQEATFLPFVSTVLATNHIPPQSSAAAHMAMHAAATSGAGQGQPTAGVSHSKPPAGKNAAAGSRGAKPGTGGHRQAPAWGAGAGARTAPKGGAAGGRDLDLGASGTLTQGRSKSAPRGSVAGRPAVTKGARTSVPPPSAAPALVDRTRELHQSLDTLAQGIHDTIDALSPRRMVLQLQTSGQAGQGTGKETSPSFPRTAQGATFPTARQVAFEPDAPGAPWPEQSSPRRATSGDSVLIKFQAQADAQQQAAREWKTVSHGGASATHADGPQPRTSKPVPMARHASAPPAPAPSPANVDSVFAEIPAQEPDPSAYHDHDEQLPSDYMEAGMEASFAAGGPSESGGSPPHPEKEIRVQGGSFSFHTQPEQQRQSDLQELVLHGHPAGGGGGRLEQPTALPAAYDRARCGLSEPSVHEPPVPIARIVPTAEGVLARTASRLEVQAGGGTAASKGGKKYAHVASRVFQETIATQAKRRSGNLPGGAANLTALPIPPKQPIMAPLTTYVPPQRSTPGPALPVTLFQGSRHSALQQLDEALGRQGVYHAFDAVYGSHGSNEDTAQAHAPGGAVAAAAAAVSMLGNVPGSGNLSVQQLPGDAPRVVRFERRNPAPGGVGGETVVPVTVVRLPEPVRVNVADMRQS